MNNHIQRDAVSGPPTVLLICLGNEYRQDDGVGPFLARHTRLREFGGLRIIGNAEGMAVMEAWKGERTVMLVDAVCSGKPAGSLFCLDALATPLPAAISSSSTHYFGIPECIALSRVLGLLPEKMIFYGIEGQRFGQGAGLSPVVRRAAEILAEKIVADLEGRPVKLP